MCCRRRWQREGAVSEAVVREMAAGVLQHSAADIAWRSAASPDPAGRLPASRWERSVSDWLQKKRKYSQIRQYFEGDREAVRRQAVAYALSRLLHVLDHA